ncbi:acyl-CoA reductase-like NAD-dependent aldehyde dehydrogenase/ABC-type branched-subunit amino acid transport system ATPase component [Roseateles asaccharophilus]|uniref:Acyl-CoA reductase-like NAD-dependent aldehyde dehydrogenase/ABC-type branched-subunit amino acid transport system ATPase component n=2 Tax=Roseateles asaccharophilus TaxID=582607 RepID=A0ABU2A3W4_9BURK|nr:acyl-CoA reductase-like NAD-dependent aldehyde dehydrogenase/ABC-type branched-subunit amino acid transport system ATPase component [Roseateles asaccharophilus]
MKNDIRSAHLSVQGLSAGYGAFLVLRDLTLEARPGLTVILGPNGAGKTTLLKAIAGLIPRVGSLKLDGADIAPGTKTSDIVQRGIALVAEGRQLFGQMTVAENLELGGWLVPPAERARRLEQAFNDFPKLRERARQLAGTMSGGEQQMVAVARALMSAPRLLMLDEPSLGLAPKMVDELLAIARRIADAGTTVLMVEQNVRKALAVADRGYVLERGRLVASGPATLLARSSVIRQAYLGQGASTSPASQENPAMSDLSMLINGLAVSAEKGATFERRNPLDGSVATRAPAASTADAIAAVDAAAEAFKTWSRTGPGERRALLLKAADALEAKAPQFAQAVSAETGGTAMWAGFNVMLAAGMLREAASLTTQVSGEVIPSDVPGSLAMGMRQPAGVVLGIAPWNAPVILGVRAIATPLACGNTVVLKGSENCPRTHQLIIEAMQDAGFPPGVVNYLTNAPADAATVVEAMVAHPAVRRVNFTGSTRVGKLIAATCAKYLKPVVLELGGKAPLLVLDDADLAEAVSAAAFGSFANSGQICMSTERLIVDDRIADAFVDQFVAKASRLPLGDPRKPEPVVLGSVVGMGTVEHCNALIDDALAKGAKLLCGGKARDTLMPATVLDRVTPDMRVYREETFGPLKCIVRVNGVEAAIACANDNEYGLSAAVFGRDIARAMEVARRIESGICHINGPTVHDEAQMPFGGVKGSGLGRFGGKAGIAEFTELRWITVQTQPRHYPF